MRALKLDGDVRVVDVPIPEPKPGEALFRCATITQVQRTGKSHVHELPEFSGGILAGRSFRD